MLGFYPLGGAPLADDGATAAAPVAFAGTATVTFSQSATFTIPGANTQYAFATAFNRVAGVPYFPPRTVSPAAQSRIVS